MTDYDPDSADGRAQRMGIPPYDKPTDPAAEPACTHVCGLTLSEHDRFEETDLDHEYEAEAAQPAAPSVAPDQADHYYRAGFTAGFQTAANEVLAGEPPALAGLDVERLQQAMIEAGLGVPYHDADPIEREHAEEVATLYALAAQEPQP